MRSRDSLRWSALVGAIAAVMTLIILNAAPIGVGASGPTSPGCDTPIPTTTTSGANPTASTSTTSAPSGNGVAGSAGTDTSLPCTASVAHATGTGVWSGLHITVNQTANLVNQTVSVTWAGGVPTSGDNGTTFTGSFGGDYLQMMECWGDDGSGTGPPPEQCEFGGQSSSGGQATDAGYPVDQYTDAFSRTISSGLWTCPTGSPPACKTFADEQALAVSNPAKATFDKHDQTIVDPFDAVDGTVVPESINDQCCLGATPWQKSFDSNPYFSHNTTNEVDFARTFLNGTGQQLFEVDTGLEAPGLGCGQPQTDPTPAADNFSADGLPKCWLVVVPRATFAEENPPGDASKLVDSSPLSPTAWADRIAIPLDFQPIGTACALENRVERIVGGELVARAVASWQPTLCGQPGAPSYDYAGVGDDSARTQMQAGTGAGMAIVTKPVDPTTVSSTSPLVYAPMTLSGLAIGFSIQRRPGLDAQLDAPYPDEVPFYGEGVTKLNLTPRLVAKLLTESYAAEFPLGQPLSWVAHNPNNLSVDPDFLAVNPEFNELTSEWRTDSAQLIVEAGSSDAAAALWQWVFADPAAKAWLAGQPDPWGMTVNAWYNTSPSTNPGGVGFGSTPLAAFPKNDPYCFSPTGSAYLVGSPPQEARKLCFQDWSPYQLSLSADASATVTANSGAKTEINQGAASPDVAWSANGPQTAGNQFVLSITTTDQAAQYGIQTASLSQDGDDGPSPTFIAPDSTSMLAAESAMPTSAVPGVLAPNPTTSAPGAYPLTLLTYAVTAPLSLDAPAQADYGAFVHYGSGQGQAPGTAPGSLPAGYVPLPSDLAAEAAQAAATIENPSSLETTTTTTTAARSATTTVRPATATSGVTTTVADAAAPTTSPSTNPPIAASGPVPAVEPSPAPAAPAAAGPPAAGPPAAVPRPAPVTTALASGPTASQPPAAPAASARTPGAKAGLARYAVLAAVLVGLGAAFSSQMLLFRR